MFATFSNVTQFCEYVRFQTSPRWKAPHNDKHQSSLRRESQVADEFRFPKEQKKKLENSDVIWEIWRRTGLSGLTRPFESLLTSFLLHLISVPLPFLSNGSLLMFLFFFFPYHDIFFKGQKFLLTSNNKVRLFTGLYLKKETNLLKLISSWRWKCPC